MNAGLMMVWSDLVYAHRKPLRLRSLVPVSTPLDTVVAWLFAAFVLRSSPETTKKEIQGP